MSQRDVFLRGARPNNTSEPPPHFWGYCNNPPQSLLVPSASRMVDAEQQLPQRRRPAHPTSGPCDDTLVTFSSRFLSMLQRR